MIHKYELPDKYGFFTIKLPSDFSLLSIAVQYGKPTMWVATENKELKEVTMFCGWTGRSFPKDLIFVGTTLTDNGQHVCHYFMPQD